MYVENMQNRWEASTLKINSWAFSWEFDFSDLKTSGFCCEVSIFSSAFVYSRLDVSLLKKQKLHLTSNYFLNCDRITVPNSYRARLVTKTQFYNSFSFTQVTILD